MTAAASRPAAADEDAPIAVVGMACIFPGARNMAQFWHNIQNGVSGISDVPASRWDPLFYDPDSDAVDRFYCRRGGFVDDYVDFDPLAYGIMPKAAASADPDQLLSLRVGVEALQDAGLWQTDFNREKTGVIVGRGNYLSAGTLRLEQHVRQLQQTLQTLRDLFPDISDAELDTVKSRLQEQLTPYGPDTAVGLIPNLVASRLANRLDLNGPAYTVDGACASALLAVEQSCQLLRRGDTDLMLTGGLHFTHDLTFWATFCQLGALSRSECIRPLSAKADGILAGEGIGMFVLKRLDDAVRDGDRVYAAIHGVGSASDGNSSSLLAPAVDGQLLALERAWRQTGLNPHRIGLVEAHGTGTPAGDKAELETLGRFFGGAEAGTPRAGLGSVKSMIGHTMPASGAAGLIKAALSVYHGVLPATLEADEPHPLVDDTRFRLLGATETWPEPRTQRLAAVNAFGFGGINAHAIISGYEQPSGAPLASGVRGPASDTRRSEPTMAAVPRILRVAAETREALLQKLDTLDPAAPAPIGEGRWRLAIIEPDAKRLALARKLVDKGKPWHGRSQIYFSGDRLLADGKTAFLFPGVDSFFNPQLQDVAEYFDLPLPDYCEKLDPARELLKVGLGLTGVNKLLNQVLNRLAIRADAMAGHSIGEWSAMAASGCLSQALIDEVNAKMDPDSLETPDVVFLAVAAGIDKLEGLYEDIPDVYVSHDNCPHQVIFCGRPDNIATLSERLSEHQLLAQQLPIESGFHSPLLAQYADPFTEFFQNVALNEPHTPLWSTNTAAEFPADEAAKKQVVVAHLLERVRFREMIANMYRQGFRCFIQVGVGSLPGFVNDTLKGQPHLALPANLEKRSGMEQLCHVAAGLWVEGAEPSFSALTGAGEEAPAPAQSSSDSPTRLQLQLGVPLVKLNQPLRNLSAATPAIPAANSDDPMEALFQQTLEDIHRASEDIRDLWHSRAQPSTFTPTRETVRMRLDVNDNIPWVLDHAFYPQAQGWPVIADRHPVIPLTMELSLMRKAVQQVVPAMNVVALEDVRAFNWLIVSEPVDIELRVEHSEPGTATVEIAGYASARAVLQKDFPPPPSPARLDFRNPRAPAITATQLYADNWMFHGPAYQSVIELGPIADDGVRGRLKVSSGEGALLDNMGQLAGYWVMEQAVDCLAMPIGIDRIEFFGPDPGVGEELECDIRVRHLDDKNCISDHQLLDARGTARIRIEGWHTRRYAMDRDFWIYSKQVHKYLLSESFAQGFVLFEDRYDTVLTRDYLAKRYLNQPETATYDRISPQRKRQWLNGRVAAKDAVRQWLWARDGRYDFWPKELLIENSDSGQPLVSAHISDTYRENLSISLAHKNHLAVAIAAEHPVGIDIESIEPRSDNIQALILGPQERALVATSAPEWSTDELIARIWSAKEAVAKQQGTGLQGQPGQFVVEDICEDRITINGQPVSCLKYHQHIISWTE